MAATVVSVVIFLCGVLVGRSVRAERSASVDVAAPAPSLRSTPAPAPTTPAEEHAGLQRARQTGARRLDVAETPEAPAKATRPAESKPRPEAESEGRRPTRLRRQAEAGPRRRRPPPRSRATQPERDRRNRPSRPAQGFAVQIAALNVRSEADAIAKRLTSKGYAAYVLAPVERHAVGLTACASASSRPSGKPKPWRPSSRRKSSSSPGLRVSRGVRRPPRAQLSPIRPPGVRLDRARAAAGRADAALADPQSAVRVRNRARSLPRLRRPASCTSPARSTGSRA